MVEIDQLTGTVYLNAAVVLQSRTGSDGCCQSHFAVAEITDGAAPALDSFGNRAGF